MSKKHQHIISNSDTRAKAQRSWRRKAKQAVENTNYPKSGKKWTPEQIKARREHLEKKGKLSDSKAVRFKPTLGERLQIPEIGEADE